MLPFLVHKIFTFYINGALNCKCTAPGPKGCHHAVLVGRASSVWCGNVKKKKRCFRCCNVARFSTTFWHREEWKGSDTPNEIELGYTNQDYCRNWRIAFERKLKEFQQICWGKSWTIWWGKFSQKHSYKYMDKWWCLLAMEKNYMFRPIAAIFRFIF